jgi:UDP-3-O-[3-hydroxymyristoyl] glucosamine N-acyltransferase
LGDDAVIGAGTGTAANHDFPAHLDCGISVIGKGVTVPAGVRVGRNCIIGPGADLSRHGLTTVADGETLKA